METHWSLSMITFVKDHRKTIYLELSIYLFLSVYLELFMVYRRNLCLSLCCSTYIIGICSLKAIGQTLQIMLIWYHSLHMSTYTK